MLWVFADDCVDVDNDNDSVCSILSYLFLFVIKENRNLVV